jgi:hypothetical protein
MTADNLPAENLPSLLTDNFFYFFGPTAPQRRILSK